MKNTIKYLFLCLLGAVTVMAAFPGGRKFLNVKAYLEARKIKAAVRASHSNYLDKNKIAKATCLAQLNNVDKSFSKVNAVGDKVVANLTSIVATRDICWKMIKDKAKKTNETTPYVQSRIRPLTNACLNRQQRMSSILAAYAEDLKANHAAFSRDVCAHLDVNESSMSDAVNPQIEGLNKTIVDMQSQTEIIAEKTGWSVTGLGLGAVEEVIWGQIRKTTGRVAGRFIAKSAGASFLCVIDGPLPIGDIVFAALEVAFLAWDGYELYKARVVLKKQLRGSVQKSIQDFRNSSIGSARAKCQELEGIYNSAAEKQLITITERL